MVDGLENNRHFPTPTVVLKNLSLRQNGRWLFRGLDLEVVPGTFVAVVGPSGVGKTSFLSCLAGIKKPSKGQLTFAFADRGQCSPTEIRRQLGFVFQNFNLTENATVLTNVLCGRLNRFSCLKTLCGFPRQSKKEAFNIIHELGISEYVHHWVGEISGGEKQRVSVARALFQNPCLYLADEPVSQLDAYLTGRVLGILKLETKERDKTVFCVMHDPNLVNRFADIVLAFNREHPEKWHLREVQR